MSDKTATILAGIIVTVVASAPLYLFYRLYTAMGMPPEIAVALIISIVGFGACLSRSDFANGHGNN